MNRSTMLKLAHNLNKIFNVLNKYLYLLPILSLLSSIKNNKYFNILNNLIKLLIIINIVLGISVILYFTDFNTPLNNTYSIYYDLLEPYIELIKNIWTKLINYFNTWLGNTETSSTIKTELESILKESTSNIKNEVRSGMKEAIDEALSQYDDDNSDLLKQTALITSTIFFIYFIFTWNVGIFK
jgi:hypothetical protein